MLLASDASSWLALPWSVTMRCANWRTCGSCDFLSAILPSSTSVIPASAAFLTKTDGAGGVSSASAARLAADTPVRARKSNDLYTFMTFLL